jgi:hypothetical protein
MDFMAVTGCIEIVSAGMDEDRQGQAMVRPWSSFSQELGKAALFIVPPPTAEG